MKIPETSANIGPYYNNDENNPWQGNGVVIDGTVANIGGVVAGGDAGFAPHMGPVYSIPRGHVPPAAAGYVVGAPYYTGGYPPTNAGSAQPEDFSEYMWMENEEEFDKQVMQQLEEEALMEQCIEAMLDDERRNTNKHVGNGVSGLSLEEQVSKSTLNPLAAEFVPTRCVTITQSNKMASEDSKTKIQTDTEPTNTTAPSEDTEKQDEAKVEPVDTIASTETHKEPTTPETQPESARRTTKPEKDPKTAKSAEVKKVEKKVAPAKTSKSESKVSSSGGKPVKRSDVKSAKSDSGVETKLIEQSDSSPAASAPLNISAKGQQSVPEPTLASTAPTMKPINYAAAAKANKPKKPSPPADTKMAVPVAAAAVPPTQATTAPVKTQRKGSAK